MRFPGEIQRWTLSSNPGAGPRAPSVRARTAALLAWSLCVTSAFALTACEEEQVELMDNTRAISTFTVSEPSSGQLRRFPGIVEAVDTSKISFEISGNTRELRVNVGDRVEQGQVLATLDDTPSQLDVEPAEAELGKAKARLAEKDSEFDRVRTLFEQGWVAKAAYDQALAACDNVANQVSYAVSQLSLSRRDFEKTILKKPFDGVIAEKFVDPFQEVGRGEQMFEIYVEAAMKFREVHCAFFLRSGGGAMRPAPSSPHQRPFSVLPSPASSGCWC